jgi:hypothetical protein
MSFVKILTYKNNKNPEVVSKKEAINAIESKQDLNLHLKIDADEPCILFGDIDYCKSKDELNHLFTLIEEHLGVDGDDMKFTINEKDDGTFTSHWTFPKLKTTIPELKKIFSDKKFEKYKKQIDTSVYRNGLFRLPYQTTKEKTTVHKIYSNAGNKDDNKQGLGAKDFIINHISKKAKEYKFKHEPEPEPEAKKETFKNKEIKLDDIEKMAIKLIDKGYFESFEDWCNLGMIINYETNASEDGLNLFDKLSQLLPNYKNKHDVSKQYQ